MTGKAKFAQQLTKHLDTEIEAACPIARTGGTTAQIAGGVGGLAGAAIASRGKSRDSDVQIGQFAWLGLAADHLAITKANFMGKPTGEALARVPYSDVEHLDLTEGKLTLKVEMDLADGRHVAFEAKRHGQNKPSVEVLELLRQRCSRS